jgi:tetratricopeptide (TPR) repeat protein
MKTLILFGTALVLAGQTTPDACAPKPAEYAPQLPAKLMEGMGRIHFPITTRSTEAQAFFDQGVAQMHSFWFVEAERSFRQAAALDAEAPMPQWGIAMVAAGDFRPRFQLQDGDNRMIPNPRAIEAAKRARELAAADGKATDLERMYIDSIHARRTKDDDAFVASLRQLVAKYPTEVEARSYLALMIMKGFTLPDKKPRTPESMEAAAILRQLMKDAPDHAGVHHYVIHGFEGSEFAKDAWHSCERYAELVPNIPHALHMPGHIYSQTGRWSDAIRSFDSAATNERKYMAADSLYGSGHHGHNLHYLAASYAFSGDYDNAIAAARELLAIKENPREASAIDNIRTAQYQGFFSMLRTLVQFRKWDEILTNGMILEQRKPRAKAWYYWARAIAHVGKGDRAGAESEAAAFDRAMTEYKQAVKTSHPTLDVARAELDAQLALVAGDWSKARKLFRKAIDAERSLRYNEPPNYPRPAAEALGQAAMRRGDSRTAERAFRVALEQYPSDWHAESGLRTLADRATNAGL